MKSGRRSFYLAVYAIFGLHCEPARAFNHVSAKDTCAIDPTAIVSDACASYETLDRLNNIIASSLHDITHTTDFFAFYRLNLYEQKCPVKAWDDETGTCGNIACKVDTLVDEKDIPNLWRTVELSKLEGPKAAHPGRQQQKERGVKKPLLGNLGDDVGESCVVEYDDECDERDYCVPEDESATSKGDYVSLVDNPERFTGYAGQPVWEAIYEENCFSKDSDTSLSAANDLRSMFQAKAPARDLQMDDECLEKRVFHRIISGMHASITTHICYDHLNQTTGLWGPNLKCYQDRLATHPARISNLYFDYAILLRAVAKLHTYLKDYTFCSGDIAQDIATKTKVLQLADTAARTTPPIFDEKVMFQDPDVSQGLKEDFRNRFRNISRLMDCVGCDKCRLWGKLQTVGYGTALKVLFEYDEFKSEENPPLRRTELVALINTLDRVSNSLRALGEMRNLVNVAAEPKIQSSSLLLATNSHNLPPKPKESPRARIATTQDEYATVPLDDDDEEEESRSHRKRPAQEESIWDAAKAEFNLVWRTYVYVLKSWVNMPNLVLRILVMEMSRLWNYWLGIPVGPRSWEIKVPSRDEL